MTLFHDTMLQHFEDFFFIYIVIFLFIYSDVYLKSSSYIVIFSLFAHHASRSTLRAAPLSFHQVNSSCCTTFVSLLYSLCYTVCSSSPSIWFLYTTSSLLYVVILFSLCKMIRTSLTRCNNRGD